MGILTNLIDAKTRQDDNLLKGAVGGFQSIIQNPDVTPEAKEYYQKSLLDLVDQHFDSTNAGGKGKKGAVGKLFGGLLTGLTGGLNKTMSRENERGKQIRGSLSQTATGSPDNPKPKKLFLTDEEKEALKVKNQEIDDKEDLAYQDKLVEQNNKRALGQNQAVYEQEFKRLKDSGMDEKEASREANALASGRTPGSAGGAASSGPVKVVWGTVRGQEDKGPQMLMVSTRNPGGFKDADGNDYTKADITDLGNAPPPPQRMFGRTLEISKYVESKGYKPGTPEYNRWFGIIAGADLRTSLGRQQQQGAIAGYESGIGMGQGFPEIPSNPKAVAEASGKDTGAAAGQGAQGGAPATTEPVAPAAKPKLTPKSAAAPSATPAAAPKPAAATAPALGSQDDRFISMYLGNLFGDAGSAGGNAKVGIIKGREALKKITGLSAVDFSMLESANKETKKAMADTIQRSIATARINDVLNEFGDELVTRAKDTLNTGSPLLNKPIREIDLATVGDPKIRRFLLAFNAFQRQYTTLTSGGPLSKAMPHVATAELTDQIMNPNMTLKEVIAAVDQAKIEGKREQKGFQESAKSTIDQISSSFGGSGGAKGGEDKEYNGHTYHRDKAGEPWKLVK